MSKGVGLSNVNLDPSSRSLPGDFIDQR